MDLCSSGFPERAKTAAAGITRLSPEQLDQLQAPPEFSELCHQLPANEHNPA